MEMLWQDSSLLNVFASPIILVAIPSHCDDQKCTSTYYSQLLGYF